MSDWKDFTDPEPMPAPVEPEPPLPTLVKVTQAFTARMPTQRVQDTITRIEGGTFGDLVQAQPFRVIAFRALIRDFPGRDLSSLWLHAYDVEVEVVEGADPTNGNSSTPSPPSVRTGT